MNKQREAGFYWVRPQFTSNWHIARFEGSERWSDLSGEFFKLERHLSEINESRILDPDEQKSQLSITGCDIAGEWEFTPGIDDPFRTVEPVPTGDAMHKHNREPDKFISCDSPAVFKGDIYISKTDSFFIINNNEGDSDE